VITEHPPQLCQTSNKLTGNLYRKLGENLSSQDPESGLTILIGPLITSDHRSFWVIQADDYDLVRRWTLESGLVQWNSVTTLPVINYEEALRELDLVEPLFAGPRPV
jgi:hypothetical protein